MANEIRVQYQVNETNVFVCIFNSSKQVSIVAGATFEQWTDSNVDTYDVPVAENGGGGVYYADFPSSIPAGRYDIVPYQGAKDGSAVLLGAGQEAFVWNGTSEESSSDTPLVISAGFVGDYKLGETIYFNFSTTKTLSNVGNELRVYLNNASSPLGTAQATLTPDIDTNVHNVAIVLSDANYDAKEDYQVVLSGATIGGDLITAIVGTFSIENRFKGHLHRYISE